MNIDELFSIQRDMNELKSLYMELADHENFNPYKSNVISDMPKGGDKKDFSEWYTEEKQRIEDSIEYAKKKIQIDRRNVNEYIQNAPYPERDIIRYRVINNLSWNEIGDLIGYNGRSVSRKFYDYVNLSKMSEMSKKST